jgi:hypothetical protein
MMFITVGDAVVNVEHVSGFVKHGTDGILIYFKGTDVATGATFSDPEYRDNFFKDLPEWIALLERECNR